MLGGSQTDLFRWPAAELYLVDGDEKALMQSGPFTLFLTTHSRSPQLVAVEATVGDVQWPVGKDCEVAYSSVSENSTHSFTFTLQSLIYELFLYEKEGHGNMHMEKLQQLLSLYTTFSWQGFGSKATTLEQEAGRIVKLDKAIEAEDDKAALQLSLAGRYMQRGTGAASTRSTVTGVDVGVGVCTSGVRKHNNAKRMHRISAVAKLFSKALLRGAIRADLHINVVPNGGRTGADVWPAVADVDAVAKVVDVVEKNTTLREVVEEEKKSLRGSWTLNEEGLHFLLKAVEAATTIAAASGAPLQTQRPPSSFNNLSPFSIPDPKQ